jgi:biopolymer transport protein ExbB/TolQ
MKDLQCVMVSCSLYSYLALYAIAKGSYKGTIIREVLEKWQKEQVSEWVLMKEIASKIDREWHKHQDTHPTETLRSFKKTVTKELRNKNLTRSQIVLILKDVKCEE